MRWELFVALMVVLAPRLLPHVDGLREWLMQFV